MKTPTTCLSLLVVACGCLLASPATARSPDIAEARMWRVNKVTANAGSEIIKPGMSRTMIRQTIGSPDKKLTPDLWLYRRYGPSARDANKAEGANGGLLIGFTGDRVSSLHLVTDHARDVVTARTKGHSKVANEVALASVPELSPGTAVAMK